MLNDFGLFAQAAIISVLHRQHRGKVTGLLFHPNATFLYSCNSLGTLIFHDARDDKYQLMRLLNSTVARGDSRGSAQALTITDDGRRLAFVGPTDLTICVVDANTLDEVGFNLE